MSTLVADAHIHIVEDDRRFGADLVFTWQDLHTMFVEKRIERANVVPMLNNADDSRVVNKQFLEKLSRQEHKNRMWAFYWPHPHEVDDDIAGRADVAGIKYHPSISQVQIDHAPDVVRIARNKGLPLLVHCGRHAISGFEYVLNAYRAQPDVKFIAAHMGGMANELILQALSLISGMSSRENLYLDTSGCMNPKILRRGIEVMGEDRVLYGTDLPFFDTEVSNFVLSRVGLGQKALRKVYHDNIMKLHSKR
jgi:predicted TIM-barrel fold metal-dependent hydrolase